MVHRGASLKCQVIRLSSGGLHTHPCQHTSLHVSSQCKEWSPCPCVVLSQSHLVTEPKLPRAGRKQTTAFACRLASPTNQQSEPVNHWCPGRGAQAGSTATSQSHTGQHTATLQGSCGACLRTAHHQNENQTTASTHHSNRHKESEKTREEEAMALTAA